MPSQEMGDLIPSFVSFCQIIKKQQHTSRELTNVSLSGENTGCHGNPWSSATVLSVSDNVGIPAVKSGINLMISVT